MSIVIPELEPVSAPTPGGRRPRLAITGVRRRLVKKALEKLKALVRADAREAQRAERNGYNALFVTGATNSADLRAMQRVIERLEAMLEARM